MHLRRFVWIGLLVLIVVLDTGCSDLGMPKIVKKTADFHETKKQPPPTKLAQSKAIQQEVVPKLVTKADSTAVLINKKYALHPKTYSPKDLVIVKVPFINSRQESRKLRREAAKHLEQMFAVAKKEKIYLAGVSAYRSYQTQVDLFNAYVHRDGRKKAETYSAPPGMSEHQTGLSIDITDRKGRCPATDCFAGTKEARWLAENGWKFGFIVRYPEGKEDITGYKYEPWHMRYVGVEIAKVIHERGITLEEYYQVK